MCRLLKWLNELYGWLVIALFGFIMLIGLWQVYDNYYIFEHTIDSSITKYKPQPNQGGDTAPVSSPITDEMVGWITIDDTNIDYPVMQASDNSYFLNTDPFGEYSLTGSIFLDSRCSPDFSDSYSVIYGHHMDYGKMFGALDDFLSESYLKTHSTGTLTAGRNAEKTYKLQVFASAKANAREKTVFDIQQDKIRNYIRDNSIVFTEEKDYDIICLSTCADADSSLRIVVFCYVIE